MEKKQLVNTSQTEDSSLSQKGQKISKLLHSPNADDYFLGKELMLNVYKDYICQMPYTVAGFNLEKRVINVNYFKKLPGLYLSDQFRGYFTFNLIELYGE